MRRPDKRRAQIERNPRHVRVEELDALLQSYGFERRQPGGGSSHYAYRRGHRQIIVAVHRPHLKLYVVLQALDALRQVDAEEETE